MAALNHASQFNGIAEIAAGTHLGPKTSEEPNHILLVDDDEGDAILARIAIEQIGSPTRLSHVYDGVEAIAFLGKQGKYANAQSPDLILLDLNMPRMDGHETLRIIRSQVETCDIPVIIMTTSSSESDMRKAQDSQANCYITKPLELTDFMDTIATVTKYWCHSRKRKL